MTDVGWNETVELDEDDPSGTFEEHSAFALMSHVYIDSEVPADHARTHEQSIKTMPTPFDRTNQDDADRAQDDLMIQLAGEVDHQCLGTLLASPSIEVLDLEPTELDEWVRTSILEILLDTRSSCGTDVLMDGELAPFLTASLVKGRPFVDVGWNRANVYEMNRHQPVEQGLYVVVNLQHVIPLSRRVSLFLQSHALDEGIEYLSARCDLTYRPRLDFHPGAVRIARVTFADEDTWKAAARASAVRV